MNPQLGSLLPSDKLDWSNYSSWEYEMNQYLVGQGYRSCINGTLENKPDITNANYPTWEQGACRVRYCLATCVHDYMLSHIRDAKMPKEAWENLKKIFKPTRPPASFNSGKSWKTFNKKICTCQTTSPRSRAFATRLAPSTWMSTKTGWFKYAWGASHNSSIQ